MDLRQLHYFIAIVEAGSFTKASELLRVAQPALSQHIRVMEANFGVELLVRHPRGVWPTEAGARLLERAREIEVRFAGLADHVRGPQTPSGQVKFGMPGTINEQLGVPLIEAAQKLFPDVRIRISEAMSGYVLDWLRQGTIDLAMLYNVTDERNLRLHHALTEEIQLFGRAEMMGAPSGDAVTLQSALRLPLVLPGRTHGLRELIDIAAATIGRQVSPTIEIDSYRQIKQLAVRGLAFGMLPKTAIRQELVDGIFQAWRITRPVLMRKIYLGYQTEVPLSTASRAIGQLSWTILNGLVDSGGWTAVWNDREVLDLFTRVVRAP
jgi:LysR family nitrogen assimilation transcriptional regulator